MAFDFDFGPQLCQRDPKRVDDLIVDDHNTAGCDGSHRQLFLSWSAELSYQEDVERRTQGAGDLVGDGNPTARQPQDDHIRAAGILFEVFRQDAARIGSIGKRFAHVGFSSPDAALIQANLPSQRIQIQVLERVQDPGVAPGIADGVSH